MRALSALLGLLIAALATAAPPGVKFPEVVQPAPLPAAVATLTADRLFVVESKDNVFLLTSPAGLVKVTKEAGPLTVYARFADGGEKAEKRTYPGPYVFLLEPVKSGECELLVVPEKVASESDIVRRNLKVDAGEGPRPPPKPDPVDPLAAKVAGLFKADPSAAKAADAAKLAAVYRQLVRSAVDDAVVTTTGKLLAVASDAAKQVVPLPALKTVREALADELDAKLGKQSADLTPALRAAAKEQFTRLATILEDLK